MQKALRIHKKNSQHSVASVSSATLGAVAVTSTSTTQATASATVTTMATVNAASGDAKTLTTSSVESTTASLTTTAASSRDGSTEPVPMDIDESVPGASPGGFWAKRPPERMPAPPTLADEYFTDSKAEMKLNFNTYKMVLVMNKDDVFYKRNALRRAKLVSTISEVFFDEIVLFLLKKNPFLKYF